ncbi:MAG: hypothetical protein N2053_10875, partial [Chitinispirillaceae bacterium]|nr:hypothetical protein [Chitinispirillaceae bacterium]
MPLTIEPDPILFKSLILDKNKTATVIEDLKPKTLYYVGLQIKSGDLWSVITESSRDTFTTKAGIGNIPNTIKLLSISFDIKNNLFTLRWNIDTTGIGPAINLETGIVWAINKPPSPNLVPTVVEGKIVSGLKKDSNSVIIDLGDKLLFSSRYYFALLLRVKGDSVWTPATDSSIGFIDVPEPLWQIIVYFRDKDSVVTAFNNQVKIWKEGSGTVNVTDTLKMFKPTVTEGFIVVSRVGIDFVRDVKSDPVNVGLKYDTTLLGGFKPEDIRMYQYNPDSGWRVIEEYKLDKVNNIVSILKRSGYVDPLILMIDTISPNVKVLSDTSRYAISGIELCDTFIISDNVTNSEIRFTYWNLNLNSDTGFVEKCKSKDYNFRSVIPGSYIVNDRSVYAKMSAYDGRNRYEINLSRPTYVSKSEALYLDSNKWIPIYTSVLLDDSSLDIALRELSPSQKWKYDSVYFRIFRWVEDSTVLHIAKKNNKNYEDSWIEYHPSIKNLFNIVPGRVIWIKTRGNRVINNMGSGITVDIKQPYSIVVKAKSWTDLSLPYKFEVKIGDIVETTSPSYDVKDSMLVYLWEEDIVKGRLHTSPKYIPLMPGKDSLEFNLTYKYGEDGVGTYSVYNNSSSDIELKIPPIPEAMSKYNNSKGVAKISENRSKGWSLAIEPRTDVGKISPVYCGYTPGKGVTLFPPSPSFGKQRVFVIDAESNSVNGNLIYHEMKNSENGFVFHLLFNNGEKNISEFTYDISVVTTLPDDYLIKIYNPQEKKYEVELKERKVVVNPESKESRYLLVGDSTFIALWSNRLSGN